MGYFPQEKLDLITERIPFGVPAYYPTEGVYEEQVLCRVGKARVAMPHVQVNHPVSGIGPDNGEVTPAYNVLYSEGIHFG